jgi:hypothetical protein
LLVATFTTYPGAVVGWRGLFALGRSPVLLASLIRVWVPESARWLIGRGRIDEAPRSLAWALQIEPDAIVLSWYPVKRRHDRADRGAPESWRDPVCGHLVAV